MAETSWPLSQPPEDPKHIAWLGIWRAHANAWRYIIDNNLGSALIIEDDVDWDVNLKDIMGLFNWQLRYNNTMRSQKDKDDKHDECEYGCDWDQLFVGHCKNEPHPTDTTHQSYHDPDSPAISTAYPIFVQEMTKKWNYSAQDTGVRVISPTYDPLCTMGYAISNKGARRALYQMGGFKPIKMAVDLEFIHHNREGRLNSYTMSPPPFVKWDTKGKGNSDNSYRRRSVNRRRDGHEKSEDMGSSTAGGSSKGLKHSVRKSLSALDGVVHEWH
jgi:GR25 family glycosyltransferase involved in LPS biosynthesis